MMKKRNNKKGFTLAELLIVVAIIAVLVAIAIPIFTAQLEKSREGTDAANIRSAYAEVMADAVSGTLPDDMDKYDVELKQTTSGWQNSFDFPKNLKAGSTDPSEGGTATFTYDETNEKVNCNLKLKKE